MNPPIENAFGLWLLGMAAGAALGELARFLGAARKVLKLRKEAKHKARRVYGNDPLTRRQVHIFIRQYIQAHRVNQGC